MSQTLKPQYVLLTDYTQAEEDTFAATLTGFTYGTSIIYNTTLGKVRVWGGAAFVSPPANPPANLPIATTTSQGVMPATGTPSGKYLRDDLTWAVISGGGDMLKSDNLSGLSNYVTARSNLGLVIGTNVLATNGSAAALTSFPTLNQNTTGTAGGLSAAIAQNLVTNLTSDLALKANLASPTFTGTVTLPASTSLTTPVIGVATGTSLVVTGLLKSSGTAGIGYATGAGGTVTQATSKSTGATLSKTCGAITMNAAALAAATIVSFVLTNTTIAATDVLVLNHISGGTIGSYILNAQCAAGSATINVRNNTAGSLSEAIVIQFVVIKGVNA